MTQRNVAPLFDECGVSLIEVILGLVILAIALLGLAAAGVVAARLVHMGREDMHMWAAVQEQVETFVSQGYANVLDGSGVAQGYAMSWTVSGQDPKQIELVTQHENRSHKMVADTLYVFLSP
jgi:Tfp pilus assembly protein PilV